MAEHEAPEDPFGYLKQFDQLNDDLTESGFQADNIFRFVSTRYLAKRDLAKYSLVQMRLFERSLQLLRDASRNNYTLVEGVVPDDTDKKIEMFKRIDKNAKLFDQILSDIPADRLPGETMGDDTLKQSESPFSKFRRGWKRNR